MRIVFCIYSFIEHNLPLQPWLTILRVAEGLSRRGHAVHVITDVDNPATIDGVEMHSVDSLRGSKADAITKLLQTLKPDAVAFLPTPLNIVTASWLDDIACRRVGFASYPFYNTRELVTAAHHIGISDTTQYLRHMLIPSPLWIRALSRRYDAIIAQSATTTHRLDSFIGKTTPCNYIPPGITLDDWPYTNKVKTYDSDKIELLYMGAATSIRGFHIALEALAGVSNINFKLRVLARRADTAALEVIHTAVAKYGLNDRVEVVGGWIERQQLIEEINSADAVLQPFVLVPSELPVTAMEVIACGTPVIGSNIDGLPSTIGPAGTVVKQCSTSALTEAITKFAQSTQIRSDWQNGCLQQRQAMLDWDTVTQHWEAVLRG